MTSTDKALTALMRSMKRALKEAHGIEVPHSALRASYLSAQGEHPHAFSSKPADTDELSTLRELVAEAPSFFHETESFGGRKSAWLKRAAISAIRIPIPGMQILADPAFIKLLVRTFERRSVLGGDRY